MFDGQAPDVEVVTDCNNDIHNERTVNTDGASQHQKHVRDLVDAVTQGTGPAEPSVPGLVLQEWSKRVNDTVGQRKDEDVGVRVVEFNQVCRDNLSHRVGVD